MKKNKKVVWIASFIVIAFIIMATVAVCVFLSIFEKMRNVEEYKFGNDSIASVKSVVGERYINSVSVSRSKDMEKTELQYISSDVLGDLTVYREYLTEEAGFLEDSQNSLKNDRGSLVFWKESVDAGKRIFLRIDYHESGYRLFIKKAGSIENEYGEDI